MNTSDLRSLTELADAGPGGAAAEAPRDSIEGAVQALFHNVIDGVVGVVPQRMKTASAVERSGRPAKIELKGTNSQGLSSRLLVAVDMGAGFSGILVSVRYALLNGMGQPVATKGWKTHVGAKDSVRGIPKQFSEWLKTQEALTVALPAPAAQAPGPAVQGSGAVVG